MGAINTNLPLIDSSQQPGGSSFAHAPKAPIAGSDDAGGKNSGSPFDALVRTSLEKQNIPEQTQTQNVRQLVNQLISVAFIKPMLAQARESVFRSDLFHGGHGEKMFQEHLDTIIADRIAERSNFDLGDAIYKKMMGERRASAVKGKGNASRGDTRGTYSNAITANTVNTNVASVRRGNSTKTLDQHG